MRDDMAIRAIKFRKTLNKATGNNANYIFLGDLNTMGLEYPYNQDVSATYELKRWDDRSRRYYNMRRLQKHMTLHGQMVLDLQFQTVI